MIEMQSKRFQCHRIKENSIAGSSPLPGNDIQAGASPESIIHDYVQVN